MIQLALLVAGLSIAAPPDASPDYRRDVEPLFKQYCVGCHSSADREGKLSLEKFDELLRGGAGGVVVVPSRPELSRLLLVLDGRAEPKMPPEGNEAPTPDEIAVLKRWIESGAAGPTGAAPDPTILVTPQVKPRGTPRDPVTAVAVSPAKNGPAAVASYGAVRLVALDDRSTLLTLSGIRGPVVNVEFSKDGKLLATAAGEPGVFGEAQLWNVADGKLLHTFTGHRDSLYAVAISPDAKLIATGSYDQAIKLWDAATGKELRTLSGHNGAIFDLAFHPGGKVLASAGADRTVKLWNVAKGDRLDTLGQPLKEQYAVAFAPDGHTLICGGADNRLRLYEVSKNAAENTNPLTITRYAHEGAVLKIVFSADGKRLASTGEDRIVRLWDAATLTETKALERQPDWAPGLALTPDGKQLVVGRMDGTFAVYDAATGKVVPPASPELAGIEPRGVTRGGTVRLTLTGKHLGAVGKVALLDAAGKNVVAAARIVEEKRTSTKLEVELTLDARQPRDTYKLGAFLPGMFAPIATASLVVDDLPQLSEVEPNNFAPQTKPSPLEVAYWGVCSQPADVDHFRFTAEKGATIVCRLEAKSLGSMLNGVLTILDADGEVAASNNDFGDDQDPLVAYVVPQDGLYTVRVNDQTMNGTANHFYRLTVGTFPFVTGVFPTTVTVGRETQLELTGFNLSSHQQRHNGKDRKNAVMLPTYEFRPRTVPVHPKMPGPLTVPLDPELYRMSKTPTVRAVEETVVGEHEPNDDPARAMPVAAPISIAGRIFAAPLTPGPSPTRGEGRTQAGDDVDLFRFKSQAGREWIIETDAARRGSPVDTKLEVLDAAGNPVPRVVLQAVLDSYITFRSINSLENDIRLFNWREMTLDEYVYISGDVAKVFRLPQGPDSGFRFYNSANKRRGYFDSSPTAHALDEPAYVVEPHPVGTTLINNGLPTFTLFYANDDDGLRKFGSDSRILFTAPADGDYLVRVSDVRGFGGDRYDYHLSIREPRPDFVVRMSPTAPNVTVGSGTTLTFSVDRQDGFDGEIEITAAGLPAGYSLSSPLRIQAGHDEAQGVLFAAADAQPVAAAEWAKVKLTARAVVGDSPLERDVAGFTNVKLNNEPKLLVTLEPAELTIAPGQMISAKLKIERRGVTERVGFDVLNLPHGVIVDNIGLNGILIPEGESEREIFLTCYENTPETDRPFFAVSKTARAGDKTVAAEASSAVLLHVRKPSPLANADEAKP